MYICIYVYIMYHITSFLPMKPISYYLMIKEMTISNAFIMSKVQFLLYVQKTWVCMLQ